MQACRKNLRLLLKKSLFIFFGLYLSLFLANQIIEYARKDGDIFYIFAYFVFFCAFLPPLYFLLPSTALTTLQASSKLQKKILYLFEKIKLLRSFFIAFLLLFHLKVCFIQRLEVQGNSMRPALKEGQKVWIEKYTAGVALPPLAFPFAWQTPSKLFPKALGSFRRGDIVVFRYPALYDRMESGLEKQSDSFFIKRVIALPKEEYSFSKGRIYIDDALLEEPYLSSEVKTPLRPEVDPLRAPFLSEKLEELGFFFSYAAQYGLPARGRVPKDSLLVLGDERNVSGDSRTFGFVPISYIIGKVISQSK